MKEIGGTMKYRLVVSVLLFCSVGGFARTGEPASEHAPTAFEQAMMNSEKAFLDAAKKGDAAFFKKTLTDDFSFVAFDGQLYERQDMLDQFAQGGFDVLPYEMKVVAAGDDVAIVTYNVVLRVPPSEDQGPPPRYQHFSTVWVKKGDAWKMKFLQMTSAHWGDW
jgi:ketosteroid isomerase-like protein